KSKSLGDFLQEQRALDQDGQALVEALVRKHLEKHGGDPARSLADVHSFPTVRPDLEQMADIDLLASLARVPAARPAEGPLCAASDGSAGTWTGSGQRFRVLRRHAGGGLGEVFVAHDKELHRE